MEHDPNTGVERPVIGPVGMNPHQPDEKPDTDAEKASATPTDVTETDVDKVDATDAEKSDAEAGPDGEADKAPETPDKGTQAAPDAKPDADTGPDEKAASEAPKANNGKAAKKADTRASKGGTKKPDPAGTQTTAVAGTASRGNARFPSHYIIDWGPEVPRDDNGNVLNPRRPGTGVHKQFNAYKLPMTVGAFLAQADNKSKWRADMNWDVALRYVVIRPPEQHAKAQERAAAAAAKAKAKK